MRRFLSAFRSKRQGKDTDGKEEGSCPIEQQKGSPAVIIRQTDYDGVAGCYKLDIGSVEEVFGSKGIFKKHKSVPNKPNLRVYKIGKAVDIGQRLEQHVKTYHIEGVTQTLVSAYVLTKLVTTRTSSLEKKIFSILNDYGCSRVKYKHNNGSHHTEIFIMTGAQSAAVNRLISMLGVSDIPPSTTQEYKEELDVLTKLNLDLLKDTDYKDETLRCKNQLISTQLKHIDLLTSLLSKDEIDIINDSTLQSKQEGDDRDSNTAVDQENKDATEQVNKVIEAVVETAFSKIET